MAARPTLRTTRGAQYSRIMGIGDFRPAKVITNDELCKVIDSTDEWIRERSGIAQRHQAARNESVVDMGVAAAKAALEYADFPADRVDTVICATSTHLLQTPAAAPMIATQIGSGKIAAYDLSAACSGYSYAIATADDLVRSGRAQHVLVVAVEKLSDFRDMTDRSTAFIFGDGAGAALVGPSDTPGISATTWGSDGQHPEMITQSVNWADMKDIFKPDEGAADPEKMAQTSWPYVAMEGPSVFRWAVAKVAPLCAEALANAGVTVDDIAAFIPHQANVRIIDAVAKKMHLPEHVVVARDIEHMANTSAASIPLAMAALLRSGQLKPGDLALQAGFGAGLTWAAQVVVVP